MAKLSSPISFTNRPWGLWATLGLSFVVILVLFSSQAAVFGGLLMVKALQTPGRSLEALARGLDSNGFAVAIATLASTPVCLLLVLWLTRLRPTLHVMNYLGLRRPTKRDLLEWCLVTVVFIVMANLLRSLTDLPLSSNFVQDIYRSAKILPLLYLAVGVMAPWFEEIFVRGFLFQGVLYSDLGSRGAVLFSALVWTLIHTQYGWYDLSSLFVFGLLLGVARLRTGSTYVAIAMHMLNNSVALLYVAFSQ